MQTGYWGFSLLEPKWFGVESRLRGSAGYQRETFAHVPLKPAGYKCFVSLMILYTETDETVESVQYLCISYKLYQEEVPYIREREHTKGVETEVPLNTCFISSTEKGKII